MTTFASRKVFVRDLVPGMLIYHDRKYSYVTMSFVVSVVPQPGKRFHVTYFIMAYDEPIHLMWRDFHADVTFTLPKAVIG